MHSAREEPDHTYRTKFLCVSWTQVEGYARPSMPQVSSPADIPVTVFLNHGRNALNTAGTLPAMMESVLFTGLGVPTPAKSALKSLYRHCPKH